MIIISIPRVGNTLLEAEKEKVFALRFASQQDSSMRKTPQPPTPTT